MVEPVAVVDVQVLGTLTIDGRRGVVVSIDNSGILVDIGAKAVAYVHPKEVFCENGQNYKEALKVGDEYEFLIIKEEDDDGQLTLSHKRVAQAYGWKKIEEI